MHFDPLILTLPYVLRSLLTYFMTHTHCILLLHLSQLARNTRIFFLLSLYNSHHLCSGCCLLTPMLFEILFTWTVTYDLRYHTHSLFPKFQFIIFTLIYLIPFHLCYTNVLAFQDTPTIVIFDLLSLVQVY